VRNRAADRTVTVADAPGAADESAMNISIALSASADTMSSSTVG
jgi:hypothetical protein